jgi:predicted ATP-grasp superfamily ATP-dependent carboligase/protein-tyrosine-phosphatase
MNLGGVIITDGNERSALAVTRSLGRGGVPVFVGAETSSSLSGSSRYCTQSFVYPSPWRDPERYIACLLDAASRWDAAAIFPMTDIAMELIGERQHEFSRSVALPIPSLAQYHQLSDKYQLTAWAEENGVPVPPTIFVPDGGIDEAINHVDTWPVIVKPRRSLLKQEGVWRKTAVLAARDADDLRRLYHEAWYLQQPSMIQHYVAGHGEGVFGLFKGGDPVRLFAHRRLRERPPSGGVSVLREAIALPDQATDFAVRIMREARWDGVAMVEFKVDQQSRVPYLMEVNGRFWGSLQLAIDAGVDYPMLLYRLATGKNEPEEEPGSYRVGTRSQWWLGDFDHLLSRLRNSSGEASLPEGTPSRLAAFLTLINPFDRRTRNEMLRVSDPSPGLLELGTYSLSALRAIMRKLDRKLRKECGAVSQTVSNLGLRLGLHRKGMRKRFPRNARKILVLCSGNICRSPFVDRFLAEASNKRRLNLEILSAGLDTETGRTAYPMAKSVSRKFGIDLHDHRTTAISADLVDEAEIILVMEPNQKRQLVNRFPRAKGKTFLLGHFRQERPTTEIADPYGGSAGEFEQCYAILADASQGFLSYF